MFVFIMQHTPTPEQVAAAAKIGDVVQLADKKLLIVPDDPALGREWFLAQAEKIEAAVGGFQAGDTVQAMGQSQLVNALNARAVMVGATVVESVTRRESRDIPQPDGTVKKESVFVFTGFRPVYDFTVVPMRKADDPTPPLGFVVIKLVSASYAETERGDEDVILAVPGGVETPALELHHGKSSDNWGEEFRKLPSGSMIWNENRWEPVDQYFE